MLRNAVVLAGLSVLSSFASAAGPPKVAAGSPPPIQQEGPTRLFNGKDLDGWTGFLKDGSDWKDVWSAGKGVLHYAGGKSGFLLSEQTFDHYILRVQYRFPEKAGDSGVLLRVQPEDKIWPKSLEAQGMSGDAGDVWLLGGMKASGDADRTKAEHITKMHPSSEKPLGEWNQYEITAQGDKAELRVNYVLQNIIKDWDTTPGRIALQAQDAAVEFKDIELWPLFDPAKPREYRRIEGLDGWHVTGNGNWTYKDGVIEGKQSKDVKTYTHLVTDKSYHDFKIKMDYKCPKGNSGLYFRLVEDATGNIHGFQSEIDEVRDAGGLYESWGRGWVSLPSKADVAAHYKINEWNVMEVEAHGPKVTTYINGWKAAETDDANVVQEGPFGLQVHGGQDVDCLFKNIEIQPLDSK